MNFGSITFIGLMAIGVVNIITWVKPTMNSHYKFAAAVAVAFVASFIPASLGNVILTHAKQAIEVAAASSGLYKIAQTMGKS